MGIKTMEDSNFISSVDEVVDDAIKGKAFILMDDERRENEGDLVVLADKVNCDVINLMITHGSGIICLAITEYYMKKLKLDLMPRVNANDNCAAFTTSIDARYGITTGVSAKDRVTTILTAINEGSTQQDIVTPGHIFPIVAEKEGLFKRLGHTEASVEIAKLAGGVEASVICELMNKDGTMSRLPEIMCFAKEYNIRATTISKLVQYLKLRS